MLVDPADACRRHGLRFFFQDRSFEDPPVAMSFEDTSVVIWSARELKPSSKRDAGRRTAAVTAYADSAAVKRFRKPFLPLQVLRASELGWVERGARSGWLDVIAAEDTFISVLYLGDPDRQKYGALLQASCLGAKGAGVQIEKLTGWTDADTESAALEVEVGDPPPSWTYFVTNVGDANLTDIKVTDDREGDVCAVDLLRPNETADIRDCRRETTRTVSLEELYRNVGTVTACPKRGGCPRPADYLVASDPSHYKGVDIPLTSGGGGNADGAFFVKPKINGQVALEVVSWQYVIENTGGLDLSGIVVSDTEELDVRCPESESSLAPGKEMRCYAEGTALIGGLHKNVATATAKAPSCPLVSSSDPTYYETIDGDCRFPAVDVEMATEGKDADTPTGPILITDSAVHWTYVVANNCPFTLTDVTVTDARGVPVECPPDSDSLPAGGWMTCTASGFAIAGQYATAATVTAKPPVGEDSFTDSDPSHYFGQEASIRIETTPDGETFKVGDPFYWEYVVTNTGNVELANVTVDRDGDSVHCPRIALAVRASMPMRRCDPSVAVAGHHQIVGTATGQPPVGQPVSNSDSGSYVGVPPAPPPVVPDRMTGGGSVGHGSGSFSHGFELRCGGRGSNNLEINWGKGKGKSEKFHLSALTSATCSDDPAISEGSPAAGFDTFDGSGTGRLNGEPGATITFRFTDAGEPGKADLAEFRIVSPGGGAVIAVSGPLHNGNHQAHGN